MISCLLRCDIFNWFQNEPFAFKISHSAIKNIHLSPVYTAE